MKSSESSKCESANGKDCDTIHGLFLSSLWPDRSQTSEGFVRLSVFRSSWIRLALLGWVRRRLGFLGLLVDFFLCDLRGHCGRSCVVFLLCDCLLSGRSTVLCHFLLGCSVLFPRQNLILLLLYPGGIT